MRSLCKKLRSYDIKVTNLQFLVFDEFGTGKIFKLSEDEESWIELMDLGEIRYYLAVATADGKIYMTGGWDGYNRNIYYLMI